MTDEMIDEAQITFVLKQAEDGAPFAEVCRKAGIWDATFYRWRKKYAGLMPSDKRRHFDLSGSLPFPSGCRSRQSPPFRFTWLRG